MTGWKRLIFCRMATVDIEAIVATKVAMTTGMNISVGSGALKEARRAITVIGITCRPEACRQRNMIWGLEAGSLSGLICWRLFFALMAKGLAASSSPSRLAEKFIIICPVAG